MFLQKATKFWVLLQIKIPVNEKILYLATTNNILDVPDELNFLHRELRNDEKYLSQHHSRAYGVIIW